MKKFFKYIFLRLIILVITLVLLDVLYTGIYTRKKGIRNKVEFISQKNKKEYDYIFLGSSRVEYHVDTDLINVGSDVRSLNMGVSGQNLSETFLLLQLMWSKGFTASKIFIQLDESDLSPRKEKSFIGASYFMPYIHIKAVDEHLKKYDEDFFIDTKIPFFRYMKYGYKIGYRELALKLGNKVRKKKFFIGLKSVLKDHNAKYIFKEKYHESLLTEIRFFANQNNFEVVFFTSPYYNPQKTKKYKEFARKNNIIQYVDSISNPNYFKDSDHLNFKGAKLFTKMLIRDFDLNN